MLQSNFSIAILAVALVSVGALQLHTELKGVEDFEKGHNPVYDSYDDYVKAQDSKTGKILENPITRYVTSFTNQNDIHFLSKYMKETLKLPMKNKFALAHGTRSGYEQRWFMEALPGTKVIGTEISEKAKLIPNTIQWDFHEVKPEWEGKVDFVYSNALDHSYSPSYAVQQWMKEVSQDGVLIIEHSDFHTKGTQLKKTDVYGDTLEGFQELIRNAGDFEIAATVQSPDQKSGGRKDIHRNFIFARHAKHEEHE